MSENPIGTYDEEAEEFHRQTGMMAPGKDRPPAMGNPHSDIERSVAWTAWRHARRHAANERNALRAERDEALKLAANFEALHTKGERDFDVLEASRDEWKAKCERMETALTAVRAVALFDCPHDAEHPCSCGERERELWANAERLVRSALSDTQEKEPKR